MAGHNEEIAIKIGAKDEASKVIDKLVKKIDGMESDEARIVVTAQTDKLQDQLDRARIKLGTLTGDEYSVQARLVGTLDADLKESKDLLEKLDGQTATVKVDSVGAKQGIDDLGKSADSSKSVLANMVGNATQDLGALGGVAGSAGVAIGQMGEYMADARAEGEGFSSILKNFAGVAGPIAAISVVMAGFSDIMSKMAKGQAATKAFDTKQVDAFTAAIREGKDATEEYVDSLEDAGEVLVATGTKGGPAWAKILPGVREITGALGFMGKFGKSIDDILPLLNRAGVAADVWSKLVTSDTPTTSLDQFREALGATSLSIEDQHRLLIAARAEQDLYAESTRNAATMAQFFGQGLTEAEQAWVKSTAATIEAKVALEKTTTAEREAAAKARLLADKVAEFTAQYDIMTGRINTSNAALDLADAFDEAATNAGKLYLQILDHSPEVEQTARDQARLQNDLKLKVIEYADELGKLPPEKITEINALIDQGDLTTAEKQLETLTRNRQVNIRIIAAGGAGYAPISGPGSGPRSVPMSAQMTGIPTSQQIAKQIGSVKVPMDVYVRSAPRITGIRD